VLEPVCVIATEIVMTTLGPKVYLQHSSRRLGGGIRPRGVTPTRGSRLTLRKRQRQRDRKRKFACGGVRLSGVLRPLVLRDSLMVLTVNRRQRDGTGVGCPSGQRGARAVPGVAERPVLVSAW
jgi:hypothetical protein